MTGFAQGPSAEEIEAWFNDDSSARIAAVNEGELVFLRTPPAKPVHHHHNVLTLDEQTLATGWGTLEQCHDHLDRVPATQIVYRQNRVRDIEIVSRHGIGHAWVEGPTVQLKDIGDGARICVRLKSRVLSRNSDGTYHVNSGPFMRRFLDGYYPMHVSMTVHLATPRLRFLDITPAAQEGFEVRVGRRQVAFDTWFEGRLQILMRFTADGG